MMNQGSFKRIFVLLFAMATATGVTTAQAQVNAYVTNSATNTVVVIDTASNTTVATIALAVGSYPFGVALSPDGARAYVANRDAGSLSVIDTATNTVIANISFGASAYSVAITPDGSRAYVTVGRTTVVAVDLATNSILTTIPIFPAPENNPSSIGIAVTPDGSKVYLANQTNFMSQDAVSIIDTATNTQTSYVLVGASLPAALTVMPNGARAYFTLGNYSVGVIDTATDSEPTFITVGFSPAGIAITPDSTRAYVANMNDGTVSVIDTTTNLVTSTLPVGAAPFAIAITPDGSKAFVTHLFQADTTVSVIDTSSNTVIPTDIHLGYNTFPSGIAITPAKKKTASDLIADLVEMASNMNLRNGITNSLDAKLAAVQASLAAAKVNDQNTACNQLGAFVNEATAQSGNQLTVTQANQLLAQAALIQAAIGCK